MIRLTRLNRAILVLNSDLIEHIDVTPDTVITLTNGQILRVRETSDEVVNRILEFRRLASGPQVRTGEPDESGAPVHSLESLPDETAGGESK